MKHTSLSRCCKNNRKTFMVLSAVAIVGYLVFSPAFHQAAGNLFFGKVPALYNVTLAQFFFARSAYPLFGEAKQWTHYQLGRTYFIQGDLFKSFEEAEKELTLYPDNRRTYYMLGLTYGYMNDEKKAIEAFGKFIGIIGTATILLYFACSNIY